MSNFIPPAPKVDWRGASGDWHTHDVVVFSPYIDVSDANYAFVRRNPDGSRVPLYWGETQDSGERFPHHEKFEAARLRGANELHLLRGGTKASRLAIETDLRNAHRTPLNEQMTKAPPPLPVPPFHGGLLGNIDYAGGLLGALGGAPPAPSPPDTNALALARALRRSRLYDI